MRKLGIALLVVLLLLVAAYGILALTTPPVAAQPFFSPGPDVLVMAHQGGEDLWPDNTMLAFQNAVDLGVDVLEMDVHSTEDGVIVVMHDESVDRTTNGSGLIKEMTYAEIRELDAAYHWPHNNPDGPRPYRGQGVQVPALEELFQAFPDMRMNIEIKQTEPSMVDPFCTLLTAYDMQEQVLVASFHTETMVEFREKCPGVATSGTEPEIRTFFVLNTAFLGAVAPLSFSAFQVPEYSGDIHVVTQRFIDGAHARNAEVHVWTVDDPDDMRRFVEMGVDGIITNRPDLLLEILGR